MAIRCLDALSRVFGIVFYVAAFISVIYAMKVKSALESAAALVYAGSAIAAVFAGDLITLFVSWELTAISSVFLVWASGTEAAKVRIEIGHGLCAKLRSHEFKAKKGGGLEIVEAKNKTGKGQASDMSEIDTEGIEVAKKTAPEAEVHRCPSKTDCASVRVEHCKPEARPAGLIRTLEASGIEATKGGGWNVKPKHTTDVGTKWFDISPSEGEIDSGDEKWFNTTEASMEASFLDDFRKGEIQEEDLREALEYCAEGKELKGLGPSKIRESDIDEARLQRLAAKGDEIVIEEALGKTQPSQGQGGKASSGKRAKGAATPPKEQKKGKGRKG